MKQEERSIEEKELEMDENERQIDSTAFSMQFARKKSQKLKKDDQCKPVWNSLSNASPIVSSLFNGYKSVDACISFFIFSSFSHL